jgi:TIR domain-containing protein/SIR2-like protein
MADWQEGFWDDLLYYIQEGTVIPVIGAELVTVREGDRDVPLYRWVGQQLAADLALPAAELPEGFDLNDVVSLQQRRRGERDELYGKIHKILRKAALIPPEPLRALAGIQGAAGEDQQQAGFNLFVSLTFDSLLADAIGSAQQILYSPNALRDLACPKADLAQPVVFHLLGKASASPNYAICDEDVLEFLHAIQDKQRQPKTLFDELRNNHLLILGCNFGDWLARFFLRTARSLELSQRRKHWDVLVGDPRDDGLALFLESFSPDAHVIPLTAVQFVAELATRWQAAHPGGKNIPPGMIFVSYAKEDLEAAGRLVEGLRKFDLEVWFDKQDLSWGDDWNRSIRRAIKRCSLFLPVISRQALSKDPDRYYWREWNDADFVAFHEREDVFIVPVVIDDTRIDDTRLPDSFKKAQGKTLLDGNVTPEVAERLKELIKDVRRRRPTA